MPRPYIEPPEPMSEIINIRCTASTKKKLSEAAIASGLSLREVIRRKINGLKIPRKEKILLICELREVRRELARQGGLIKHLYNENPINKKESGRALNAQKIVFERLGELIAKSERIVEDDSEGR